MVTMKSILHTGTQIYVSHLATRSAIFRWTHQLCLSEITETTHLDRCEVEIYISVFIVLDNEKGKSHDKFMVCYS